MVFIDNGVYVYGCCVEIFKNLDEIYWMLDVVGGIVWIGFY